MNLFEEKERKLLNSHDVSLSEIFDANGLSSSQAKEQAKALEKPVLSNTPACGKCGNRIRTRSWHCIECNRAALSFQKTSFGHVYIAGSPKLKLLKIGKSNDYDKRMENLKREEYGGGNDWRVIASCISKDTGKVERFLHKSLSEFNVNGSYTKGGREQQCYELYKCNFSDAFKKLKIISQKKEQLHIKTEALGKVFEYQL